MKYPRGIVPDQSTERKVKKGKTKRKVIHEEDVNDEDNGVYESAADFNSEMHKEEEGGEEFETEESQKDKPDTKKKRLSTLRRSKRETKKSIKLR